MSYLFERFMQTAGYDIGRATREISTLASFSAGELESWQGRRRHDLARFHYEQNPLYRAKVGASFPERWEHLPVVDKSDFQSGLGSVITRGMTAEGLYRANTSGSSGHPFWFVKDKYAHACAWALIRDRYAWHRLSLACRQARFYGVPLERWPRLKETVKDSLMNRVRFPVFDLSEPVLRRYARRFERGGFEYLYGYANSLATFARYLLQNGLCLKRLCPSLRICITTSEVCAPEDLAILRQGFGVRVVNEYGASEVGVIAFENPQGRWILSDETVFVEAVDAQARPVVEGESGDLLITDLRNRAMPFIRYRIGDAGAIQRDPATGKRELLRLEGGNNDTIVLPSGRKSPGVTFYYISKSMLESSGALQEFIVRQTAVDEFVFDIVSDRSLTPAEEVQLRQKVDVYLEPGLNVRINRVPQIQRPASGKLKHFYSELPMHHKAASSLDR
jgi:phenylacetate-CoA ligase